MKKKLLYILPVLALALASCESLENKIDCPSVSGSYPRKHLIEHFTGAECGYCPNGMAAIEEAIAGKEDQFIWISNHYGFGTDEYTVPGNETVGKKLGVSGAPNMAMDREKVKYESTESAAYAWHPGYLPEIIGKFTANTSFVSVDIARQYDASSRELHLNVTGNCENKEVKSLLLTVVIKESGTIGKQKDYINSWNGWSEFRHVKTIRQYVSAALGDTVAIKNGMYSADYSVTLPEAWVAENCCAVAFLTWPGKYMPVLNAEQVVVVEGTKGGEDILSGGITMKSTTDKSTETSGGCVKHLPVKSATWLEYEGHIYVELMGDTSVTSSGYKCTPYMQLVFNTGVSSLPNDSFPVLDTDEVGSMLQAHHVDSVVNMFSGSMLYYLYTPYLNQGEYYPLAQYLIKSGYAIVDDTTMKFYFKTYRGYEFTGSCARPSAASAPARKAMAAPSMKAPLREPIEE